MFTVPLYQQVPSTTLDELRKIRDAKQAVRSWKLRQVQRAEREIRRLMQKNIAR